MARPDVISVNTHQAKTELSRLLRQVEQGATVEICRDGEPVAQMTRIVRRKRRKLRPIPELKVTWNVPPERLSQPGDFDLPE